MTFQWQNKEKRWKWAANHLQHFCSTNFGCMWKGGNTMIQSQRPSTALWFAGPREPVKKASDERSLLCWLSRRTLTLSSQILNIYDLGKVPKKRKNWYPPTCPNSLMFGTLDPWFPAKGNIFWKWMLLPPLLRAASRMYLNLCNACTFSSCIWSAGWQVQLNHTDQMWTFHMWA